MLEHGGVCPHRGNVSASCSLFLETSPRHRTEGWASRRAVSGRGSGGGRDDICCVFLLNVSSPGGSDLVKNLPTMWETRVQSLGQEDPLEKEMATHSSVLTWRIPRTEEPGGLSSMGSQRVRHD